MNVNGDIYEFNSQKKSQNAADS